VFATIRWTLPGYLENSRVGSPISLSAKPFCQGEPGALGVSRMPNRIRTRLANAIAIDHRIRVGDQGFSWPSAKPWALSGHMHVSPVPRIISYAHFRVRFSHSLPDTLWGAHVGATVDDVCGERRIDLRIVA
jgi:hypothetical protein